MSTSSKRIVLGADHGGFGLRQELAKYLTEKHGLEVEEFGSNGEAVDYPDVAEQVCSKVNNREYDSGILLCGSGIGISIAANKVDGIRCALCHDHYTAKMARVHNDANVLALGGRTTGVEVAKEIVDAFLGESFMGQHHVQRLGKIAEIEKKQHEKKN